jgi:Tfp pilus assembly protein PilF
MIEATLFGQRAWGFHLVNVLLHGSASVLVLLVGFQWFGSRKNIALIAGLLFAAHPVHVEVVAWVSGRSDLLLGLFLLLALLGDCQWGITRKARWQVLSLTAFGCALFSKEAAAVFPLLVATRALLNPSSKPATFHKMGGAIRAALPALAVLGLYLWLRFSVVRVTPLALELGPEGHIEAFWTWWSAFWLYTRLLVWPSSLNILHQVEMLETPLTPTVVTGLLVFLGLLIAGWKLAKREPGVTYGIVVWLLLLLPASHFLVPLSSQGQTGFPFAERFLYAPSIGFCLATGWLLASGLPLWLGQILSAVSSGIDYRRVARLSAAVIPLLVIAGGGARAWIRSSDWRDEVTLFAETVQEVPSNGTAQLNYAAALGDLAERAKDPVAQNQLLEEALPHFHRALELVPENYRVHFGLGNLYRLKGEDEQAEAYYRESLRLRPELYPALLNLGVLLAERGDLSGAIELFRDAIRLRPRAAKAQLNLAHVLLMSGRQAEALALYKSVLEAEPGLEPALEGIRRVEASESATPGNSL